MATISLYANKINQMPGLVQDVKKSVLNYKAELSVLKNTSLKINQSICNMDDVVSSIQASSQTQEEKVTSLEAFRQNSERFIEDAARIDGEVADVIRQRKDDFYEQYSYLKPECEKNNWEKICDGCKKFGEWCREHWKAIVTAVVVVIAVVALVAITVVTAGAALGPILTIVVGVCKGIITGAIIGGLMGGLSSVANGESFWAGFEDGAFSGMITGAIFGGIGGSFQALGSSCNVLSKLGLATKGLEGLEYTRKGLKTLKIVSTIAKISGYTSLGMFGFDFLAKGAGVIWGKDNAFTAFNTKLHKSSVYNGIQLITGITALASGGFAKGMRNPVCFVAGTLVLTSLGLVAIENIKAGDKVISTDPETFETAEKTVLETYIREVSQLVHLTINGELITTTVDHPFYVKDYGFVNAGELYIGDKLLDSKGNTLIVEDEKVENLDETVKVYNFQVEDFHTYYVGKNNVLVHNAENYGKFPTSRDELDARLKEKGFEYKGQTQGGYVKYKNPAGEEIWIRPNGEVIRYIKEPIPDAGPNDKQFYKVRYMWDGNPVPDGGHNTGQFVESINN